MCLVDALQVQESMTSSHGEYPTAPDDYCESLMDQQ